MTHPLVWTIPAGQPFAERFVREILARAHPSRDLADTIVLVPTNRAARTLARAFVREARPQAVLLPRILPLGELGEEEFRLEWDDATGDGRADLAIDLKPAIGAVHRQVLLTRLVASMRRERAGGGLAEAARLARELGRLLDSLQNQNVSLDDLDSLVEADLAEHWQETLRFLEILRDHWPRILEDEGLMDPAARRSRLLQLQAAAWTRSPPQGPIIVAGSTGSMPAARDLIKAVSRLPRGEVVTAGLDRALDAASWETIEESHPQFGLKKLLETLGAERCHVRDWPGADLSSQGIARARLLSEAMRPATTSHRWPETVPSIDIAGALAGMHIVEARDSIEEAGAIAVLMREAIETPGKTAALVTNDRDLARRVRTTLRRWELEVDDSGGEPLAETIPAILFRLAIRAAASNGRPVDLLALLKHPLATGGEERHSFLSRVRDLEHRAARRLFTWHGFPDFRDELRKQVERTPALSSLEKWFRTLEHRMAPLRIALGKTAEAAEIARNHREFVEWLVAGDGDCVQLYADHAGDHIRKFFGEFEAAARSLGSIAGRDYPGLFDEALEGIAIYPRTPAHPRLSILSSLEARMVSADRMIAGGLVEGTWPRSAAPSPWLSRSMQTALGVLTDAHRAGMGAHDFVDAASVPEACLSFAHKTRGNPTVRSRWLTRLNTVLLAGGHAVPESLALALWRKLTAPPAYAPRPAPRFAPPLAARPRKLSVTQVRTLMEEPYAIYARHVLGLRALNQPGQQPGPAEFGTAVHRALERFTRETARGDLPTNARTRLLALGAEEFARFQAPDLQGDRWWERFAWSHRFAAIANWFLHQEQQHRREVEAIWAETTGAYEFGSPAFTLTARADRIEIRRADKVLTIADYKTGSIPSKKAVLTGLEPQLPLAGVIAEAGGFPEVAGNAGVHQLVYWRLTGRGDGGQYAPMLGPGQAKEALTVSMEKLQALIARYDDPDVPYEAVHEPEPYSDYAALARSHEWTLAGLRDSDE